MAKREMHWQIRQMIDQMGGLGITGAFAYIGANQICSRSRPDDSKPDPSVVTPQGAISYQVGLQFAVNGKRGEGWKMVVAFEPSDTYTVRLWRRSTEDELKNAGVMGVILDSTDDVYCDNLQRVVESMYDRAIEQYCNGFISLD